MEEKTSRNIRTFALGVAASLHALFPSKFLGVDASMHSQKKAFIFERTPEVEKAVSGFYNNSLIVPPAALLDSVRTLKQRVNDNM